MAFAQHYTQPKKILRYDLRSTESVVLGECKIYRTCSHSSKIDLRTSSSNSNIFMSVPTHVETFPLIFEVDPAHKINYVRNIRRPDWDLSKEKEPLNLWQPNVEPGPKGGKIIDQFAVKKKQRTDFKLVTKKTQLTPNQQNWKLTTGDKTSYTFQCDEGSARNFVLLTPRPGKFTIQFIDDDFSATKDTEEQDYETCEKLMELHQEQRYQQRKELSRKYLKALEEEETNRKKLILDQVDNGQLDEEFVDVDDWNRIGDHEIRNMVKQRIQALNEDAEGVDAPLDRSDDETFAQDVDESKDDLIDMEELNALFEDGFLDEEDEYEEDGEKKDKKEKKKEEQKPEPLPSDQVAKNIDQIVEEVNGPRIIREEEFVRYFLDNGQSTGRDLMRRFKDYMKTPKQRDALVKLIKNKCKKIDKNGVSYFQLRSGK